MSVMWFLMENGFGRPLYRIRWPAKEKDPRYPRGARLAGKFRELWTWSHLKATLLIVFPNFPMNYGLGK